MITIKEGGAEYAEEMHAIEAESFAAPWSEMSIRYEISQKHSVCFVAIDERGVLHGHAYMRHVINEGHINNLAVRPESRRRGIASRLAEALIQAALTREMIGLTLEVRTSNHAAIALYEKLGFVREGIRKNYYSHPTEDGIIMWKYLTEVQICKEN